MDINSIMTVCSLCAMLVVAGYSAKNWYRYFQNQLSSNE